MILCDFLLYSLRYRLQQRACSQGLFLRLEASALLDVQELRGPLGRRELRFTMLESQQFKVRSLVNTRRQGRLARLGRTSSRGAAVCHVRHKQAGIAQQQHVCL